MYEINVDWYGVVKESEGLFNFTKCSFSMNADIKRIMEILKNMSTDSNYTILDMQETFVKNYPQTGKSINWIPNNWSYDSSFIGKTSYPKILDINEYNARKVQYNRRKEEAIREKGYCMEEDIDIRLKEEFYKDAISYIKADELNKYYNRLRNLPDIRFVSHNKVGWETITYNINKDIIVTVVTNFYYGASSYFDISISYKGIKLSPYSHFVRYYYASMRDIISYTRSYEPRHSSWEDASIFIVDISNKLRTGDLSYIREWLHDEIQQMTRGLNKLVSNPRELINKFIECPIVTSLRVRNINSNEKTEYKTYGKEFTVAYMATKVSDALNLIESLRAISELYEPAKQTIEDIKSLCLKILPTIINQTQNLSFEIELLNNKIQEKEQLLNKELQNIRIHTEKLEKYYSPNQDKDERRQIMEKYERENPDYVESINRRESLNNELNDFYKERNSRNNFLKKLQDAATLINNKAN